MDVTPLTLIVYGRGFCTCSHVNVLLLVGGWFYFLYPHISSIHHSLSLCFCIHSFYVVFICAISQHTHSFVVVVVIMLIVVVHSSKFNNMCCVSVC